MKPILQVLIATYGEAGLQRIAAMNHPSAEGVAYLVSCQCPGEGKPDVPEKLRRTDMTIIFSPTRGLSVNRNILMREASAPICLIADDDISYKKEALEKVIGIFRQHQDLDIATLKFLLSDNKVSKPHPEESFDLRYPPKGYFITSFEIAFRRESVERTGILFNENFGVGTDRYTCGEEELWIHDLLQAGLRGRFFPEILAVHHGETTGVRDAAKPGVLRAHGALIARIYSFSLARAILKGWRVSRSSGAPLATCMRHVLEGWATATFHPSRLFTRR